MPLSQTIYIFGWRYGDDYQNYDDTDWNSWDGTHIWTIICKLFGWDAEELGRMRLCSVNWKQNGYDYGPIACQIVWHLMTYGLRVNTNLQWKRPKLPCSHNFNLISIFKSKRICIKCLPQKLVIFQSSVINHLYFKIEAAYLVEIN